MYIIQRKIATGEGARWGDLLWTDADEPVALRILSLLRESEPDNGGIWHYRLVKVTEE